MGEVYKAKDTRLDRSVAVKVLPSHLSTSPDLKARFEREARAIAALSHPHICAIHDVGSQDGVEYLVMELLEGQTLADRLDKGVLPLSQLLPIGIEIAGALDAAHHHGIVHRDLKPGNVMLTKSGVKLLDFGLAKMAAAEPTSALSSLPTELAPSRPLTEKGTVMGTFQYMAPEQLEGKPADSRTDIFSFGCVLYEMATGRKAFTGANQASLVTAIMSKDPEPISTIQPMTPPALDRVVKACFAKDPEARWQSARDVASELTWIAEAGSQAGAPAVVASRRKSRERLAWIVAVAAILVAVTLGIGYLRRPPKPASPVFTSFLPPEKLYVGAFALSPDGKRLAFTAGLPNGTDRLFVRTFGEPAAQPVAGASAGSEEPSFPFWSPDGKFIAYFVPGSLKKVDPSGGPAVTICPAEKGAGGSWSPDGTIVFAPTLTSPLFRVSSAGGKPEAVTKLDASLHVTAHRYPSFLPDGRHFLYMAANLSGPPFDNPGNAVRVGSLDGKTDKALVAEASNASFADGYLLYVRQLSLIAQKLNLRSLDLEGDSLLVAQRLSGSAYYGYQPFAASDELLLTTPEFTEPSQMSWLDRNGRSAGTVGEPGFYLSPRLSPDGGRIAVDVWDRTGDRAASSGVWLYDARGVGTQLTNGLTDMNPIWSPSGDRIIFVSYRKKQSNVGLWIKTLDGSAEQLLVEAPDQRWPEDWSRDGRFVSIRDIPETGKRNTELWIVDAGGEHKARPIVADAEYAGGSRFSPDGRWLAYGASESGKVDVYVRTFPEGKSWKVSSAGGSEPRWRGDGKELYYLTLDDKIMAVPVSSGQAAFSAGPPTLLFAIHSSPQGSRYDVTADGQRFLVNQTSTEQGSHPLNLVVHWTALLKKQ
jgi:eukaryotic-like serine/threonine-protein kinase